MLFYDKLMEKYELLHPYNEEEEGDDRKFVSTFGHVRHQLANMCTGHVGRDRPQLATNLRGRIGLEVIHVDVTGTTQHPQQNTVHLALWFGCLLRP